MPAEPRPTIPPDPRTAIDGPLDPSLLAIRSGCRVTAGDSGSGGSSDARGSRSPRSSPQSLASRSRCGYSRSSGPLEAAVAIPVLVALAWLVAVVRARPSIGRDRARPRRRGATGRSRLERPRARRRVPGVGGPGDAAVVSTETTADSRAGASLDAHSRPRSAPSTMPPRPTDSSAASGSTRSPPCARSAGTSSGRASRDGRRRSPRSRRSCWSPPCSSRTRRTRSSPRTARSGRPRTARPSVSTTSPRSSRPRARDTDDPRTTTRPAAPRPRPPAPRAAGPARRQPREDRIDRE